MSQANTNERLATSVRASEGAPYFLCGDWCGLQWTPFVPFEADRLQFRVLPQLAGLYRVRVAGRNELAYIGQTGRDLRERLQALRQHTLREECPWNDPHTAAPKLWSFKDADGLVYECSAAATDVAQAERLALECYLLWQYRVATGRSTHCNYGRLHPSYGTSTNRREARRGGRLPAGQFNPAHAPCIPPLRLHGDPPSTDWMGLQWTTLVPFAGAVTSALPSGAGVYKLLDAQRGDLLYVGESENLRARLKTHFCSTWGNRAVLFSYCSLPEMAFGCQRCEVETDLLGGYYATHRKAPLFQFGNTAPENVRP